MAKGRKRLKDQQEKDQNTLQDLKAFKGLSKYQRKKMVQSGIDIPVTFSQMAAPLRKS